MTNDAWRYLQLFAGEGSGGDGGAGAAATGESAADPGVARLMERGVPEALAKRNRAYKSAKPMPQAAVSTAAKPEQAQQTEQAAAAQDHPPTEEKAEEQPREIQTRRMSWEEIMADPEYNKSMQQTIQARLKTARGAQEALAALNPALELLAKKYKLDPNKLDHAALARAISDDDSCYEDRAMGMGVSVDAVKKLGQQEQQVAQQQRELERQAAQQQRTMAEQRIREHFQSLEQQAQAMKATFPGFDLKQELKNPVFARMTSPSGGVSVEDAYYAVHRREIQAASMQAAVKKTAQQMSNAIQAGSMRPAEAGTASQAPSVTTFDYSKATRAEREALKSRIRSEAAQGRKVYPGR